MAAHRRHFSRSPEYSWPRRTIRRLGQEEVGRQLGLYGILRICVCAYLLGTLGVQGQFRRADASIRRPSRCRRIHEQRAHPDSVARLWSHR